MVSTRAATRRSSARGARLAGVALALVGPFALVQRADQAPLPRRGGRSVKVPSRPNKTAEAAEAAAPATSVKISVKAPSKYGAAAKAAAAPPAPAAFAASTMTTT